MNTINDNTKTTRTPADATTCGLCNRLVWKEDVDKDGRCSDCPKEPVTPSVPAGGAAAAAPSGKARS